MRQPQTAPADEFSTAARLAGYDAALDRFSRWMTLQQNPDGSFRGDDLPCNVYMPMAVYGQATGRHEVGERALHFVETRYVADGRLVQTGPRRQMMPYTPAWFVMGSTLQERLNLRSVLVKDLLSYQDPRTGGFFGSAESRDAGAGMIDFDSTTQACAALCIAGQERAALKCGEYLRALARAQPDPERQMLLQWDSGKGLVKDFDPAKAFGHVLVYAERKQHLYKIGLLARAFAFVYGLTGDKADLALAESHYRRAVSASPDIWSNTLAHKMAWAAWTLYGLTGDRYYVECGCNMADHLLAVQRPEGSFNYPEFWASYEKAPTDQKINLGAQFAIWISYVRSMAAASTESRS